MNTKVKGLFVLVLLVAGILSWSDDLRPERDYWPTEEWRTSSPGKQGMDAAALRKIDDFVKSDLPKTSSVLVVRHGYVVFERYYSGDASKSRDMLSETKAVMSALVGIAIDKGHLAAVEQPMLELLPDAVSNRANPAAHDVTLRHLLTLSDGIASSVMEFYFQPNRLTAPFRADPGSNFFYNNLSPQLLSVIITTTTGLKAHEFALEHLFKPLGITSASWTADHTGYTTGAYGLSLSTQDMARFGYLYLNRGRWEGQQVVPEDWVAESTRPQIATPYTDPWRRSYGYLWWLCPLAGHAGYYAAGSGGQFVVVVPDLDIVAVITGEEPLTVDAIKYIAIVERFVVPAVRR